jgi:hypothetical protein
LQGISNGYPGKKGGWRVKMIFVFNEFQAFLDFCTDGVKKEGLPCISIKIPYSEE